MNTHSYEIELATAAKLHPTRQLRDAWGEFVARWAWEWFVTQTFKVDPHPERALKLFRVWCSKLSREIYGHRWHKRGPYGVAWVVAVEFQKTGRLHLHALIAGVYETRRLTWMDNWEKLDKEVTGYSRIEAVDNQIAVSRYVSKYVAKEGNLHFSKNLGNWHCDLIRQMSQPESET